LIAAWTPNGIIGSFIISLNWPDIDMSIPVWGQQKTSGMLMSWWTNSIATTEGSRNSGGKGSN